ncbi:protein of unknown function [Nitrospira japonica]|uniref:Uncharacterized protein n=1 Tax=Nitrospira japonica TaxID=1325564 RepID=A0A1W1I862_9BACT|nr:protein of unknown function [Nitrospira japonica]
MEDDDLFGRQRALSANVGHNSLEHCRRIPSHPDGQELLPDVPESVRATGLASQSKLRAVLTQI